MNSSAENKIVIFAFYEKLASEAIEAVKSMGLSIEVAHVTIDNYIEKARQYKSMNKEIIIARGLTANNIRANVDINIVNIETKVDDIINLLSNTVNLNKKIGLFMVDSKLSNTVMRIGEIFGLNIQNYFSNKTRINNENDIDEMISDFECMFEKDKVDTLIGMNLGDNKLISKVSEMLNIEYKIIDSSKEAIIDAVKRAVDLYDMTMKERLEKEKLEIVLEHCSEGILAIDKNGVITAFNYMCEKYFSINGLEVIGRKINDIFPEFKLLEAVHTREVANYITAVKGVEVICNIIPIRIGNQVNGVVASIKKTSEIRKAEKEIRLLSATTSFYAKNTFDNLIGKSDTMKQVISLAKMYSEVSSTILIIGESGTGKEVLAQAIHNNSPRKNYAFVPINCASLSPNLLESELFGYSDGAFTGSRKGGKQGLFELAHNGTIFLDEIGDMDLSLQAKILRVIQEKQVLRIGDDRMIPVDVRIISATNKDLYDEVLKGNFRLDLYYRLNVLELNLCPLKDRKEDLPILVDEILYQLNNEFNFNVVGVDAEIFNFFLNYNWPGNIRELRNILERLAILTKTGTIKYENVKNILIKSTVIKFETECMLNNSSLEYAEKNAILCTYKEEGFNKQRTADKLGISRNTLKRKLEKYNINLQDGP